MEAYLTSLCRKAELELPGNRGDPRLRARSMVEDNIENPISASLRNVDELAMQFYQHAVKLCQEFGCPFSSIRVEFHSWGVPAGPEVKSGPLATELIFDGANWKASRIRVRARTSTDRLGTNVRAAASCFLRLEAEPDALLKATRRASTNIWTVQVGSWRYDNGKSHLSLFDPHSKTNTIWQLAVFKKIKSATTQKECEEAIEMIVTRSPSRKEAIQLLERIRANPNFKGFSVEFKYRVENLIMQSMASVLGTATVWIGDGVESISTEF